MISFKQLKLSFDYPPEFNKHNHDLVGYIIHRNTRKVIATAVLTRASIDTWYSNTLAKYPTRTHIYLLGTISILGGIVDLGTSYDVEDPDDIFADEDQRTKSKSKYQRHHAPPEDPKAN